MQVAFRCSSAGCQDSAEAEDGGSGDGGQMLIVSRLLQTVRAVDATFGTEKWVHWQYCYCCHDFLFYCH